MTLTQARTWPGLVLVTTPLARTTFTLGLPLASFGSGLRFASVKNLVTPRATECRTTLPILLPSVSVNQRFPSAPAVISRGLLSLVGTAYSMIDPVVLMRPILLAAFSVNHRLPSGPAVMPDSPGLGVGTGYSIIAPVVVMRPMLLTLILSSVNQRLPSGPAVMNSGSLFGVGTAYSVIAPVVVILPMLFPDSSVNHRLPSGPEVISIGLLLVVGTAYSMIAPLTVILPILLPSSSVNQRLPSGPAVIPTGVLFGVGTGYCINAKAAKTGCTAGTSSKSTMPNIAVIPNDAILFVILLTCLQYVSRREARQNLTLPVSAD